MVNSKSPYSVPAPRQTFIPEHILGHRLQVFRQELRGSTLAANRLEREMVDPDTKDYAKVVNGHNRLPFHAEKGLGWIAIRCDFDNVISAMLIHLTGTFQTPVRTLITFFRAKIG